MLIEGIWSVIFSLGVSGSLFPLLIIIMEFIMTYEQFKILYKNLVIELLRDDAPKVPNMIFSKSSAKIADKLSDLCEEYPDYEERVDCETWSEI
jgi:uroporphyrinogen-III decarboxylase